jgi:hypothetical protein
MDLEKKKRLQMIEAIDTASEELTDVKKLFLRKAGWSYTCQTPGSFWLWTKKITVTRRLRNPGFVKAENGFVKNPDADGWVENTETYDALCDIDTAIAIQKALENASS